MATFEDLQNIVQTGEWLGKLLVRPVNDTEYHWLDWWMTQISLVRRVNDSEYHWSDRWMTENIIGQMGELARNIFGQTAKWLGIPLVRPLKDSEYHWSDWMTRNIIGQMGEMARNIIGQTGESKMCFWSDREILQNERNELRYCWLGHWETNRTNWRIVSRTRAYSKSKELGDLLLVRTVFDTAFHWSNRWLTLSAIGQASGWHGMSLVKSADDMACHWSEQRMTRRVIGQAGITRRAIGPAYFVGCNVTGLASVTAWDACFHLAAIPWRINSAKHINLSGLHCKQFSFWAFLRNAVRIFMKANTERMPE